MIIHTQPHPLAGQTVRVEPKGIQQQIQDLRRGAQFVVEDWEDRIIGQSWKHAEGNPAALQYAFRVGLAGKSFPLDDEVVYGHINGLGYLVHATELGEAE